MWAAQGYDPGMASATIVPPPPISHRRVYHMMEGQWARVAIKDRRLEVSRFADLNDPFELLALSRHTPEVRQVSKQFAAELSDTMGLLSFGKDWSSVLMWSRYAKKHTGICLGFDVRRDILQSVSSEDQRIRKALGGREQPDALPSVLQQQLMRTKAAAWAYKQEMRRFIQLDGVTLESDKYFVSFDQDMALAEVILGPRCSENLNGIRRLLSGRHHAVAFAARLAYRSFRVVVNGYTRPSGSPRN
jgi:hypothetical protein